MSSARNFDLLDIGYIYGGLVRYQPGEVLSLRNLTDYELVLIVEGQAVYSSDGEEYSIGPGDIVFARPGFMESYRWDRLNKTVHAFFHFSIERYPSDWPEEKNWPRVFHEPPDFISPMFRHLLRLVQGHSDWPALKPDRSLIRLVEALIDALFDTHSGRDTEFCRERPEPVAKALKWMRQVLDEDPGRPVRLKDIAAVANITETHLCRLFTVTIGYSPMQTFNMLRLQLSLVLLSRSNLSIKEIAERCGFDNPLYFSRYFSKTFGKAPSIVREDAVNGKALPNNPLPTDLMPRVYW